MMRKDNRYTSATKIVRDIIPTRKASESMSKDYAGPIPRKLRGRNKYLSVDCTPLALEHKRIELRQFHLARELLFLTTANQR